MADATLVRVGVTGVIQYADLGTALPTTATEAPVGFTDVGYISDSGVAQSIGRSVEQIRAWGGDTVRTIQTEHDVQYTFTMIETSPEVLELYYNDPAASATLVSISGAQAVAKAFILDVIDGDKLIRLAIPDAQVTATGDVTYATEEAIGYEVTIDCRPDNTGVKVYKRMADAV